MTIETEPRYCSVCEEGLEAKDLDGICGDCYKKARMGKPAEIVLSPAHSLMIGIGYGLVGFLNDFLGRHGLLQKEPDVDGQECFRAWCDRIGMPY